MNTNDMIVKLYSLLGSRAVGNTSDEVRNKSIIDSLFLARKMTVILFTTTISGLNL